MPTGYNTDAMAINFFLDTILLLHIYGSEGYLSLYKTDEMVSNHSNSCKNSSDFKKICANIAKDDLSYLVTPTSYITHAMALKW